MKTAKQQRLSEPGDRFNPFLISEVETKDGRTLNDIKRVIMHCTDTLKNKPEDAKVLYLRANAYMRLGELDKALGDCSKHLLVSPESIDGFYLRGCIHQRLRKIDKAMIDFNKVLEKDPNHFNAKVARASCFNYIGDIDRALADYEEGLLKSDFNRHRYSNGVSDTSLVFGSSKHFFETQDNFTSPTSPRTRASPNSADKTSNRSTLASRERAVHLVYRNLASESKKQLPISRPLTQNSSTKSLAKVEQRVDQDTEQ